MIADFNQDVPNLRASVARVSIETIEAAGIAQSSLAEFNSLLSSARPETFHSHSAFYIYHVDATFFSRRALREALCSYYGAAGSLLRSACEAILRGAFWECLAHKRYRDHAAIVDEPRRRRKIEGVQRNILNWMNDVFQAAPHLEALFEQESGAIFDRISALFESRDLIPAVPSLKTMVEQLSAWKIFEPIADSVSEIYDGLYRPLCEDTHLVPGRTMMGRLMVAGKDPSTLFEPSQEEFGQFLVLLRRVAEIGALTVLNVVERDVQGDRDLRAKIGALQNVAEQIELRRVVRKIHTLTA